MNDRMPRTVKGLSLPSQVEPISRDDYFAKNPEFSAWLRDLQVCQPRHACRQIQTIACS